MPQHIVPDRDWIISIKFHFPLFFLVLQNPPDGVGAVGGEDLFEVGGYAVIGEAAVTQDGVSRLFFGNGFDHIISHIFIKTGDQEVIGNFENFFAGNLAFFNFAGKRYAQLQHHLEKQIFRRTVGFDVADQTQQIILSGVIRGIIDVFHIGTEDQCRHGMGSSQNRNGDQEFPRFGWILSPLCRQVFDFSSSNDTVVA